MKSIKYSLDDAASSDGEVDWLSGPSRETRGAASGASRSRRVNPPTEDELMEELFNFCPALVEDLIIYIYIYIYVTICMSGLIKDRFLLCIYIYIGRLPRRPRPYICIVHTSQQT